MTLTLGLDLGRVKENQRYKYLFHKLLSAHSDTQNAIPSRSDGGGSEFRRRPCGLGETLGTGFDIGIRLRLTVYHRRGYSASLVSAFSIAVSKCRAIRLLKRSSASAAAEVDGHYTLLHQSTTVAGVPGTLRPM